MGPLTLGYARWANLAPAVTDLQSFGHASVSEDGELTIKLIVIDGTLMYEKTMSPMGSTEESSTSSETETESTDSAEESTPLVEKSSAPLKATLGCAVFSSFVLASSLL